MEKNDKAKDAKDVKPAKDHNKDKKKVLAAPSQNQSILKKRPPASGDFRGVIRLVGKDMDGHYYLSEALRRVKGIGHTLGNALSNAILIKLSISPKALVGDLTEDQLNKIEEIIKNPKTAGIPSFMLNRRKDIDTGEDKHLLGTDLIFQTKQDIQREKDTRSWIGWRHSIGQKVRGQHNRTTGRSGLTVGVVRKSIAPASAGTKDEAKK